MKPRVVYRTHYQVDEPAIVEVLVKCCTSPVNSAYDETVAERLAKEVRRRKKFNVAAAAYALDLARGLGVTTVQNTWSDKGHLINILADVFERPWEQEVELTSMERLMHFRLFFEGDGAALLFIARYMLEHKRMPNSDDDWNDIARDIFSQIYSEYLQLSGTTANRVLLRREIERIRTRGYAGKSGAHKMFLHLQTMHRLGLVDREPSAKARHYCIPRDSSGLYNLVKEVPSLYELERVVTENTIVEVAARVFEVGSDAEVRTWTVDEVLELCAPIYERVMKTGVPLCPLATVLEAIQISVLVERSELLSYATLMELLRRAQRERPADIRFHVDRRGVPAFLKLSIELLASFFKQTSKQTF
jgi:hypothetical protein